MWVVQPECPYGVGIVVHSAYNPEAGVLKAVAEATRTTEQVKDGPLRAHSRHSIPFQDIASNAGLDVEGLV